MALESIRGLGALQVLLLHVCSAYAPTLVDPRSTNLLAICIHYSPLYLVYDGYAAVYIFFILSGLVLTPTFTRFADRPFVMAAGRILRLATPAIAAATLAAGARITMGSAHEAAGAALHSEWLIENWRPPAGLMYFVHDAFAQAPFLGYWETSLLRNLPLPSPPSSVTAAYVAPLWTLSIELQGSFMLLAFVACARLNRSLWAITVCAAGVYFCRTYFLCFVVGHLLAMTDAVEWFRRRSGVALAVMAAGGMLCCIAGEIPSAAAIAERHYEALSWLPSSPRPLEMIGALLIFLALVGSARAMRLLEWRPLIGLGRISFPLYLIHWPILFGFSAALYVVLAQVVGGEAARVGGAGAAIALSLLAACAFAPVDRWSIAASRRLRASGALTGRARSLSGDNREPRPTSDLGDIR